MSNSYEIARLGDLGNIITGKTPSTKRPQYYGGNVPFLTPSDNMDGKFSPKTNRHLTNEGKNAVKNCVVPKGSISMSCIGSDLGKVVVNREELVTNQQINTLIPDPNVLNNDFAYYLLLPLGRYLNHMSKSSTAVPIINKTQFSNCEVRIPSIKIQKKIADILSSFDKKIELNTRINNCLEDILNLLCKQEITNQSQEQISLGKLCNIFTGRLNANQNVKDGIYPFFTCGADILKINSYIFDGPAVIVSGNGSYTGRTQFYDGKFNLYQRTYACTANEDSDRNIIYGLYPLIKNHLHSKISGGTHGSSIPYIVMSDLSDYVFNYSKNSFMEYSKHCKNILQMIQNNNMENEYLTNIRDALLPKLMSGKIEI